MFMHSSPIQMYYNLWLKFDIIAASPHLLIYSKEAQIRNAIPINMNHSNDHLICTLSPSIYSVFERYEIAFLLLFKWAGTYITFAQIYDVNWTFLSIKKKQNGIKVSFFHIWIANHDAQVRGETKLVIDSSNQNITMPGDNLAAWEVHYKSFHVVWDVLSSFS